MRSLKECIRTEKSATVELYSCVAPSLAPSTSLNLLQTSKIFIFKTTFSRNWGGHYASIVGALKSIESPRARGCKIDWHRCATAWRRSTSTNWKGKSPRHSGKRSLRNGTRKNTRFVTTGAKICERLETKIGLETDKCAL